ncbi:MAG: serine--tRNA ligase [Nanoarchaeota archaeon]
MIDIKDLRERPDVYKKNLEKKGKNLGVVESLLTVDEKWRNLKKQADDLRAERNSVSEAINQAKKHKDEQKAKQLILRAQEIPERLKKLEELEAEASAEVSFFLKEIPNIMSKNVPPGKSDKDNVVEKVYGKPKKMNFPIKSHGEIAEELGLADFDSSRRVAGTGFYYLEGDLALLNQALLIYARDIMIKRGFRYVETPLMLKNEVVNRVTDLNDQKNMIYRVGNDEMSLIGTSEHSLIGRFIDQEIDVKKLPIKHTSYSMCFRKEIGGSGIDEKGIFRTHQFNKIEMIIICMPKDSEKHFEEMKKASIEILKGLKIPFRIIKICSGDLGDMKYEQVDFEVYSPRRKTYIESGSCSNLTTAQARKLGISTRINGERIVPHTLNNTAMATPRPLIAILENNQQKDGSVKIPAVLWKYMNGKKVLEAKKSVPSKEAKVTKKKTAKKK